MARGASAARGVAGVCERGGGGRRLAGRPGTAAGFLRLPEGGSGHTKEPHATKEESNP
jgi:hypothetical protein